MDPQTLEMEFAGELYYWRGPSPYHFVPVPEDMAALLHDLSPVVSYGWGVIPVSVRIGETDFETSLFPKDGGYVVPIKDLVRKGEDLADGDTEACVCECLREQVARDAPSDLIKRAGGDSQLLPAEEMNQPVTKILPLHQDEDH